MHNEHATAEERNCSNILKRNSIDVRSISSDRLRHVLARVQTKKRDKVFIMMHLKKDFFIRTGEVRVGLFLLSVHASNPFSYLYLVLYLSKIVLDLSLELSKRNDLMLKEIEILKRKLIIFKIK